MSMVPLETEKWSPSHRGIVRQRDSDWISLTIILAVTVGLIALYIYAI